MKPIVATSGVLAFLAASTSDAAKTKNPLIEEAATSFIVGGTAVNPGDYPYFVEMGGCGGSLVAPDTVLFAAHCKDWSNKQINIGAYKTRSTDHGAQGRFCDEWIPDPLYKKGGGFNNNDFALCKLNRPVDIDQSKVRLVLNEDESIPSDGENLEVIGFGWLDTTERTPTYLQEVTVPAVPNELCLEVWEDYFTETMMCAGYFDQGGKDSCKGDSGGPIVKRTKLKNGSSVHTHLGVVSYGHPCANEGIPTVYARTSSRIDWIKSTMCDQFNSVAPFCQDGNRASSSQESKCEGQLLSITLKTDIYGDETSWTLKDKRRKTVKEREFYVNNFESKDTVCLESDECYEWEIRDSFGDGLCGSEVCGFYEVKLNGKDLFSGNGDFKDKQSEKFCTLPVEESSTMPPSKKPTKSPTRAPTRSPTKTPTKSPTRSPIKATTMSPRSPTRAPTKPTRTPTRTPTKSPQAPTRAPTKPTRTPTRTPTKSPRAPTKTPTKPTRAPTRTPTKPPSAAPVKSPSLPPIKVIPRRRKRRKKRTTGCVDNNRFRWKGKKRWNCKNFLKAQRKSLIQQRCEKQHRGKRVSQWCPATCGRVQKGPCKVLAIRE